jgi:hypothetical protein
MTNGVRYAFAWYFHLPVVATAIELCDHVRGSLSLLLREHRETAQPLLLAPTGSFLRLCERHEPSVLEELSSAAQSGLVEIAGTCCYETDPLSIGWSALRRQLRVDLEIKHALLGATPRWYFAPNFVWRPGVEVLCAEHGLAGVVLDSRHLAAASVSRSWRWDATPEGAVHVESRPLPTEPWEHRALQALDGPRGEKTLRIAFRDWEQTRALTFGNDGAIHRADGRVQIEATVRDARENSGSLVVVADDGDRITGTSHRGYRTLLDVAGPLANWRELVDSEPVSPSIRELPAFSPPGIGALLRESDDARYYWSTLRELEAAAESSEDRLRLLALHDVFYAFWPGVGRRRWYVEQVTELLQEHARGQALGEVP